MTDTLELRSASRAERRDRLFEHLDDADPESSTTAVTDADPVETATLLDRYRIERGRRVDWEADRIDAETREIRITTGEAFDADEWPAFDVRDLPPQRRHEELTGTFDALEAGEGFVLVNDHDPKPLYHELRSTRGETIEWEYLSEGAGEWRVRIGKTGDGDGAVDDAADTTFDVREIPKAERHPTIHHRYGTLLEGATMELVAPHEPRPLHREFRQQYGESFTWAVVEEEPGRCRVRITKEDEANGDASGGATAEPSAPPEGSLSVTEKLDVRELPPARRHEAIFEAYEGLAPGEAFVLVNDHDPEPLYHQFDAEAGPAFRWEYRRQEPGAFEVLIGRAETDDRDGTPL
ncbi:DUF2249 domain-containing protein [Haloplanus salilacus]|uniref:DUF2249 domain-containing protein n=1 Tax=Haloplanus salilacus TaxID=2949994 RepID=UPI0030D0CE8D